MLPIFKVDLHCALHRVATSSCRGHVDKLATEPFLLLHREHGTCYRWSWNCCDRQTCFVVIWKHFCFILSTGTKIRIDSVMCPRSSSRGRNTSASVTVTVKADKVPQTECKSSSASQEFCWAYRRREPRQIHDSNCTRQFAAESTQTVHVTNWLIVLNIVTGIHGVSK